jgi:hypothetical protein
LEVGSNKTDREFYSTHLPITSQLELYPSWRRLEDPASSLGFSSLEAEVMSASAVRFLGRNLVLGFRENLSFHLAIAAETLEAVCREEKISE